MVRHGRDEGGCALAGVKDSTEKEAMNEPRRRVYPVLYELIEQNEEPEKTTTMHVL